MTATIRFKCKLFLLLSIAMVVNISAQQKSDPYLTELYWELNNSPMQQKLRTIKPFPVGVVYWQQQGHTIDSIRHEFQIIRDLGFTALKQVQLVLPESDDEFRKEVFHMALDVGVNPWYYGKGGWQVITEPLLNELNIDPKKPMSEIQADPAMIAYQNKILHDRVERMTEKPPKPEGMGEPGRNSPYLPERLLPVFAEWLEDKYGTMPELKKAWNEGTCGSIEADDFSGAAALLKTEYVDEFGNRWGKKSWDFRRMRDAMRFQADLILDNYIRTMEFYNDWDPEEPERTGGHQLFENQAINSWDLEGQAKAATIGGSFYSSIHLTHHFFLVDNEIFLPVYMQARTVADMFKGGWSATWESTGGPTTWSGHSGFTVDENTMKHLMYSYIAAGLKGVGFWMWNSRDAGWETGEYALTDIQGQPTERTRVAGKISKILQNQRFELWDALDEPLVGVLYSWETEAMLGRLSMGTYQLETPVFETRRDRNFRQFHSEGRIGISRALINDNIPFEYITERDLAAGLAGRYEIIYLPYTLALTDEAVSILKDYVHNGGRLVADFPLLMLDDYGRLNKQYKGSDFEQLFGFQTADYYHTHNDPKNIAEQALYSQYGELKVTSGEVIESFSDGTPAVISNKFGEGSTLVFNFEASRACFKPGNVAMENLLLKHTLADKKPVFKTNGKVVVFRRSAPKADHYFILNNEAHQVVNLTSEIPYSKAVDLYEGKPVDLNQISIPANSGVWIRCEK